MSVGFVMLTHTAFRRAAQVARHWAAHGCPVVIHVDRKVPDPRFEAFRRSLSDQPLVKFSRRYDCEWGTWGMVAATQDATALMLHTHPDLGHVYLCSGSCLPLRPAPELIDYLEQQPDTDFIESVTTEDVPWTVGGLALERFTMRFPFSWRRHRRLFDGYVRLQRRVGYSRRIPKGLEPHLGSQWWCLTRRTLTAILNSPDRETHERYFRRVWIPDESYFQTLVRRYARKVESRSLTLSKFDFQGKPHIFYDDHLQLLRRSDCFIARKIWPHADKLYSSFLTGADATVRQAEPNPGKIDRVFARAVEKRTRGRPGLYMQSRFPNENWENGVTSARYSVFHGFSELFDGFEGWVAAVTGVRCHGHLFAPEGAEFAGGQSVQAGALSAAPKLRDYNPKAFLTNLIWNTRGERQCFLFGPRDSQGISWTLAKDPNANISVITGAWAVPLFRSGESFATIRREAARLQQNEVDHVAALRSPYAKCRLRVTTLADFIEAPMETLQAIVDDAAPKELRRLTEAPRMTDLTGFGDFLQALRNQGMNPHMVGDYRGGEPIADTAPRPRKPYVVAR